MLSLVTVSSSRSPAQLPSGWLTGTIINMIRLTASHSVKGETLACRVGFGCWQEEIDTAHVGERSRDWPSPLTVTTR
jgi:hypothetical protein